MANDITAPLEGAEAPGFFSRGWALDKGIQSVDSFFEWAANMVKDTTVKVVTWQFDLNPMLSDQDKAKYNVPQPISDNDRALAKESKAISGWQMAKDIGWALIDFGKDKIVWTNLSSKLNQWISEDDFNKTISKYRWDISSTNKIISDIMSADPKFAQYRDFDFASYKKYLDARGITSVQDPADYEAFKKAEMSKLNALDQQLIVSQYQELQNTVSKYQQQAQAKQAELDWYLNSAIKWDWEKTGVQVFEDVEKESQNRFKDSQYLQYNQKVATYVDEMVTKELEKDGKSISGLGQSFTNLKDSVVEQMTASEMYRLDLIGMDDLPDNEKYAQMWGEASQKFYNFNYEFMRRLSAEKDKPENKWVDEVALRQRVQLETWRATSPEDKEKMRWREALATGINAMVNAKQLGERITDLNPQALLDGLSLVGTTFQSYVDQAFDYNQEIPHYIQQETRSLLYSDEGNLRKFWSYLSYNADALASMAIPIKGTGIVTKGVDKLIDVLAKNTDKFVGISTKVWFTQWFLKFIPNAAKGISNSLVNGAVGDPVFDNLMMQAPTAAVETMNNIANLFFDASLFTGGKWLVYGLEWTKNMNGLMFKFLHWDEAAAVKDWTKAFNDHYNPGQAISEAQGREILEQGKKLYGNMYSPQEIKKTFNEKWGIYRYLADNVSQMTDSWIKEVLTGNGLGIRIEDLVGIPRKEIDNLNGLFDVHAKVSNDETKTRLVSTRIEEKLNAINDFVSKWSPYDDVIIQQKMRTNPEFLKEAKVVEIKLAQIKSLMKVPNSTDEIKGLIGEVDDSIRMMKENYTNRQWPTQVTLVDSASKNEIKIGIKDLRADLDGKNFSDIVAEGRVTIKKDTKNIKQWDYFIKGAENNVFSSYVESFMKNIENDISEFEIANNLDPLTDKIRHSIQNGLLNTGKVEFWYLAKFTGEQYDTQIKALWEFVNKTLKNFYGEKFVNPEVHFLGKQLVSNEDVIKGFNNNPGYINLTYGTFAKTDDVTKITGTKNIFYVSFGKDIASSEVFAKKLDGNPKGTWATVTAYIASASSINKLIVKYGIQSDWSIDFFKGLQKAKIVESTANVDGLFIDWKISQSAIAKILDDAIKWEDMDDLTRKWILDLANGLFSASRQEDSMVIKPMIYSLVSKYYDNKPLIDELFTRFRIDKPDFIKAFADILMSPDTYKDIAAKMASRWDQKVLTESFRVKHQQAWLEYHNRLQSIVDKLDIQIDDAKATRKLTGSAEAREFIDMNIETLKSKKSSVLKVMKKEQEFKNNLLEKNLQNINVEYLKNISNDFSFTKLLRRENLIGKGNPEDQLKQYVSMREQIKDLYPKHRDVFDSLIRDIEKVTDPMATMADRANLIQKYEDMAFSSDILKDTVDKMIRQYLFPQDGISLYDVSYLSNMIDSMKGKYTYNFAKENNPLKKWLWGWINNTNTGRNDVLEAKISEYFKEPTVKSADEMYDKNPEFRDMIDSLRAQSSSEWDVDVPKVYVKAIRDGKESVRKFISEIFHNIEIDTDSRWNISAELVDDILNEYDIIKKLKAIANRKLSKNDINVSLIEWETEFDKVFSIRNDKYNEKVLQIENMEKAWMNFRAIRGFSVNQAWYIKIGDTTLNKLYDQHIVDSFIKDKENPNFAYSTSSEKYKLLTKIINNTLSAEDYKILNIQWWKETVSLNKIKNLIAKNDKELLTKYLSLSNKKSDSIEWIVDYISSDLRSWIFDWDWTLKENIKANLSEKQIEQNYNTFKSNYWEWNKDLFDFEVSLIKKIYENIDSIIQVEWSVIDRKSIISQLGIPEDHVFVGNFGDKDSLYTTYKSGLDIYTGKVIPEIEASIYKYEYAFANGYTTGKMESFEQFKNKFLTKKFSSFEEYKNYMHDNVYETVNGKRVNQYILPRDTIRKREAFNMSNDTTFEDYVVPTKTYIIEKELKQIPELQNFPMVNGEFDGGIDDLMKLISDYPESEVATVVQKNLDNNVSVEKIINFLNTTYNNDLQDGTSFVSNDLARTRAFIQWGNRGVKDFDEGKRQFKDHYYGDLWNKRFWAKTLFNASDIQFEWAPIKNAVVVGDSSMKLKGGYKKYDEPKEIMIDGKMHKVLGEVEGTNTSFFKNAASDSFKDHSDLTMSDSIKGRIPVEHAKAIEQLQIRDIKLAFQEALWSLSDYKISLNSFGDVTELIKLISSEAKIGMGADAIVKGKMTDLLVKIDGIINKPKNPGQSMFIRESNLDIGRNEVIMSKDSSFVIQARKEIQDEIDKLDPNTDVEKIAELKKDMKDGLYTVGYRYPVPSIYNLGVYKIRIQEDLDPKIFGQYKNMGKDQVITHPLTTYMKLEGDNDGDHVFFLSARWEMGKILSNAVLWKKPTEEIIPILKSGNWDNKFIVAEQVEKGIVNDSEDVSLLDSRSIALEAKASIGVVSATLRTLGTLSQMMWDSLNDDKKLFFQEIIPSESGKAKSSNSVKTLKFIKDKIGDLSSIKNNPEFDALAASILQTTLDFGNSGKTTFDKDWYMDLLEKVWIPREKIPDIYYSIISPLSIGYNKTDIKQGYKLWLATFAPSYKKDLLYWVTGSKRDIYEFLLEGEVYNKRSIAQFVNDVNKTHDLKFITDTLMSSSKDINVKAIIDYMNKEIKNFSTLGYIKKEYRGDFKKFIGSLGHSDQVLETMKMIDDYHEIQDNYLAKKEISKNLISKVNSLSPDERAIAALYGAANGESNLFNYFTTPEKLLYLTSSDQTFVKDIGSVYGIKLPKDSLDYWSFKDEIIKNISDLTNDLKWEKDEWAIDAIEYNLEKQKAALSDIDQLITDLEAKKDIPDDIVIDEVKIPEVWEVVFPEFTFAELDTSPQSANEILSEHVDMVTLARDWWKLTMQSMFNKYSPRLALNFDTLADFLNAKNRVLSNASNEHVRQFGDLFFGYKNSIYRQLKKAWVPKEKLDRLGLVIQHSLIGNAGGVFHWMEQDVIIKKLTGTLEEYGVGHLINDPKFMDEIFDYNDKVISVAVEKLNQIQESFHFDIYNSYKDLDLSMITDLFEAHKWDAQFALKLTGIKDRQAFEKYIMDNAAQMGEKPLEATVRSMGNAVYKNHSGMDFVLNFVKWVHYEMTYGTAATLLTQNNIVAGLTQILPNYTELRSFIDKDPSAIREWLYVMSRYNLLDAEDVLQMGTWFWKNMKNTWLGWVIQKATKDLTEGTLSAVWVTKNKAIRASEFVDSVMNNMLGFNDWPLENLRKIVATKKAMDQLWYKTAKELEDAIERGWLDFEMAFRSHVRRNFANTGWWVVSSSPIASGTVFENSYEYLRTGIVPVDFFVEFGVKSLWYLMWWSFHKSATLLEKESALFTWLKKLVIDKDPRAFKAHFSDWAAYNLMLGRQVGTTMGLYLKFQKYEKDNDDRISLASFQKQFNNAFVAILIPLERHFAAFETAEKLGTGSDATLYTMNSVFKQMTRLFKQWAFFNTMFDRYREKEALGEADMLDAMQYAMDVHYTAYMRFSGMQTTNDYYNTLGQQTNLGILWVGGNTLQDDIAKELMEWSTFTSWKEKWFIWSLLSGFSQMFRTSDTDLSMSVAQDLAKEIRDRVTRDPQLSKLLKGWQIGTGIQDYNITNLVGNNKIMSPEEEWATSDIWKEIQYYAYKSIDKDGKLKVYGSDGKLIVQDKIQQILEERITKELAKKWINISDIIARWPGYDPALLKTIAVLGLDSELKTPLVIATLMEMENKKLNADRKKTEWVLTGEKSAYGTPYKTLTTEQYIRSQRDIILKYQEYFNLDNNLVQSIIEKHIAKNNVDLFEKFDKVTNLKFIKNDVYDLVKREYLARSVMNNWDTKVSSLQSRYALAYKGIKDSETWVQVVLNHLRELESLPAMDAKTKLANQAAALMSLNTTQYGLLKNNKEFAKLTEDSQKQITNWLFKVSSASLDFDSNTMASKMNQAAWSRQATGKWYARVLPKPQSSSFSWQRPNFSQQFSPIRDFIPGKEKYLSSDPNRFLQAKQDFIPRNNLFNPAQFPIVQEYAKIMISNIYYGYESKGTIRTGSWDKKFDKTQNTSIKIAKPKKAKATKEFKKFKIAPKVSMWMRPDLPLANYWD